jgi:glycosyltransferase involved in cell wall biosynthesis
MRHRNPAFFRDRHGTKDAPVVTYLGRKVPYKGIETLIDAMPLVWQRNPGARLALVGPRSAFSPALRARIEALGAPCSHNVITIDDCGDREKSEILSATDVLVLPSRFESFGIVLLEAWSHGKPVIGCRDSPPGEVIANGVDGLLHDHGDSVGLAEAIVRFLENPRLREACGENGRRKLYGRYRWEVVGKAVRDRCAQL